MKTPAQKYISKKKSLHKKAKALWQELVVKSNPNCEGMGIGCIGKTQVGHHFIYVSASNHLRYDIMNGIGLCLKCHFALHNTGKSGIVYLHIIQGRSEEWGKYIDDNKQVKVSTTLAWYEDKIKELEKH